MPLALLCVWLTWLWTILAMLLTGAPVGGGGDPMPLVTWLAAAIPAVVYGAAGVVLIRLGLRARDRRAVLGGILCLVACPVSLLAAWWAVVMMHIG